MGGASALGERGSPAMRMPATRNLVALVDPKQNRRQALHDHGILERAGIPADHPGGVHQLQHLLARLRAVRRTPARRIATGPSSRQVTRAICSGTRPRPRPPRPGSPAPPARRSPSGGTAPGGHLGRIDGDGHVDQDLALAAAAEALPAWTGGRRTGTVSTAMSHCRPRRRRSPCRCTVSSDRALIRRPPLRLAFTRVREPMSTW